MIIIINMFDLYDTSIEFGCPNSDAQLNKCGLQGCARHIPIKPFYLEATFIESAGAQRFLIII